MDDSEGGLAAYASGRSFQFTKSQIRGGSLVLAVIAGTVAFSGANLIAMLTAASAVSDQQSAAFTLVFTSPLTSTLNVCLCIPLMLVANRIDKGDGPQEYQKVCLRKPGLLLSCSIVIVFVDAFLAVPQIHSMLAGRSLAANIAAVPQSIGDALWLYLVGAAMGRRSTTWLLDGFVKRAQP